jgi:hypothetical protein
MEMAAEPPPQKGSPAAKPELKEVPSAEKDPPPVPPGTPYYFVGMLYMAGRIEFRDVSGEKYPNYFYEGKFGDVRGKLIFDPQNPKMAMLLNCSKLCQPHDGMPFKILGEWMRPDAIPQVSFAIHKMGAWKASPPRYDGKLRKHFVNPFDSAQIEGILTVQGRDIPVKTDAAFLFNLPDRKSELGGLAARALLGYSFNLSLDFTLKGQELGLKEVSGKEIRISVRSRAFTEATLLAGTKKKTLAEAGAKEINQAPEKK